MKRIFMVLMLVAFVFGAVGCKSDEDKVIGEFEKLAKALEGDDCAAVAKAVGELDPATLKELMGKMREKYPEPKEGEEKKPSEEEKAFEKKIKDVMEKMDKAKCKDDGDVKKAVRDYMSKAMSK